MSDEQQVYDFSKVDKLETERKLFQDYSDALIAYRAAQIRASEAKSRWELAERIYESWRKENCNHYWVQWPDGTPHCQVCKVDKV